MRKFGVLLKKEIRELITPQILLPLAITVLVFAFIGNVVGAESERAGKPFVAVVDLDRSAESSAVLTALEGAGFETGVIEVSDVEAAAEQARDGKIDTSLVIGIPERFGERIAQGRPQRIESYVVMRNFSMLGTRDASMLRAVVTAINEQLSDAVISSRLPGADPQSLKRPVMVTEHVIVGDRSARTSADEVVNFISGQTTFIPIVLFVVIIFAAQMIATTIASEKENKTLETLLASPVSRGALVSAKMVAAAVIALASAAAYMIGMRYYMDSLMSGFGGEGMGSASAGVMERLGLTLTLADYGMLGLTLFAGILVALAVSVILGAFAENVRAVQSLITPLMVAIMIPYFLTMFVDLESASQGLRWLVLAIPFSYPFLAAPNLFLGNERIVWFGIAYQMVWFVAFSWIAARIFSSDRILTMKLGGKKTR